MELIQDHLSNSLAPDSEGEPMDTEDAAPGDAAPPTHPETAAGPQPAVVTVTAPTPVAAVAASTLPVTQIVARVSAPTPAVTQQQSVAVVTGPTPASVKEDPVPPTAPQGPAEQGPGAPDQIVIVEGPDGTTMHIQTPEGVPLEAVQALLGIEGSEESRA